jgi:hypothetical protein
MPCINRSLRKNTLLAQVDNPLVVNIRTIPGKAFSPTLAPVTTSPLCKRQCRTALALDQTTGHPGVKR